MPAADTTAALGGLRRTPDILAGRIGSASPAVLTARPFAGKWTPLEILGHLVDHEIVSTCRIRTARFEPEPWRASYVQDEWVRRQRYNESGARVLLERFRLLRALNLEQYEAREDDERERIDPLIARHADHDRHHLDQLERFLDAAERHT